jgi:hypothetical protein
MQDRFRPETTNFSRWYIPRPRKRYKGLGDQVSTPCSLKITVTQCAFCIRYKPEMIRNPPIILKTDVADYNSEFRDLTQ